jgi:uncharacterized protein (DUF58 family)
MAYKHPLILRWLETHWVRPAYAGGVLLGLAIAFFGAAVNSMAGWLYAISGVMLAIAAISIWLPPRNLRGLQITRQSIRPVSVGEPLMLELALTNPYDRPKVLLEVSDKTLPAWGDPPRTAIAAIPPHHTETWRYTCRPTRRGIYHWEHVTLRTAVPLGLFWCQRCQSVPADVVIYPEILPLAHCPLIDQMGTTTGIRWQTARQSQNANEGVTRAVRPYRWGDPTRLIHWRTSARYGALRVRELEELTADNQVLLGLDTSDRWSEAAFESAVVAIASLYTYCLRHQLAVGVWLPHTGILQNKQAVLGTLATVMPGMAGSGANRLPGQSLIWFSSSLITPPGLPAGSAWVRWIDHTSASSPVTTLRPIMNITLGRSLTEQLQSPV